MTSPLRKLVSVGAGVGVAVLLPIYPWKSETRSQVIGDGGDVITHDWDFEWCFVLPDRARYVGDPVVPLLLDALVFVAIVGLVGWGVYRRLGRRAR
jgi:hypothetical protein